MKISGLTTMRSHFGPKETTDRLEAEIRAHGMTVFARIDHARGAAEAGLELRPTELIIFGNARAGTPLMQSAQTIGIDLPLKALVWQDAKGKTQLSYNEPSWMVHRHGVADEEPVASKLTASLTTISRKATEDVDNASISPATIRINSFDSYDRFRIKSSFRGRGLSLKASM